MEKEPMIQIIQKTKEYLNYIEDHYNSVQKAWKIIQEKCDEKCFPFLYDDFKFFTLDKQIKEHDLSKLSMPEFVPYRQTFFPVSPEEKEKAKTDFAMAWEHHKANNDHHWENWTKDKSMGIELCVAHNVCDWMAMGMKFNDTARDYYDKNKSKMQIPEWADTMTCEIFDCVYGVEK